MEISHFIFARTQGMVLLDNGKPKKIGGVAESVECEMADGITINAVCVYFNLVKEIASTDFFIFRQENDKLIGYSIGEKTEPFFIKMYEDVLSDIQNHDLTKFIREIIAQYVIQGLMGSSSLY
jgi:hypothetical protein